MFNLLKLWIDMGGATTPWMFDNVGNHLLEHQKLDEAEQLYRKFQKEYPQNNRAILGLVKVARFKQNWPLALEILDVGIQQFPDYLDFYYQKINILVMLNQLEKSNTVLEEAKARFHFQLPLVLAEVRLKQTEYAYEAAQSILNKGVDKYPSHFELAVYHGYNSWLLGNYELAMEIFDRIHPKIDLTKGYLNSEYTIPYINLLLRNQRLHELKQFFEDVLAANIWNKEILFGYCQLLVSMEEYKSAKDFIQGVLNDKASPVKFIHQILLLFELEKIKNLEHWNQKSDIEHSISNTDNFEAFIDRVVSRIDASPSFEKNDHIIYNLVEKLKKFSTHNPGYSLNTATSPYEAYQLANTIIDTIQKGTPFSLIRLGDGEGSFLPYRDDLKYFQQKDQELYQRIWWGSSKIGEESLSTILGLYTEAVLEANVLGVPDLLRCCTSFLNIAPNQNTFTSEARGLLAIFDFLDGNWKNRATKEYKGVFPVLTSCHIHSHLEDWNLWGLILNVITECSIISCHEDLGPLLEEKHRIKINRFYKIPSEFKYSELFDSGEQTEIPHFPDVFEQICTNISVSYPGEVVIVAAGFLGKIYCNIIKQRGGIALDAGSAVDYWLDYKTRVWTKYPTPITFGHVT